MFLRVHNVCRPSTSTSTHPQAYTRVFETDRTFSSSFFAHFCHFYSFWLLSIISNCYISNFKPLSSPTTYIPTSTCSRFRNQPPIFKAYRSLFPILGLRTATVWYGLRIWRYGYGCRTVEDNKPTSTVRLRYSLSTIWTVYLRSVSVVYGTYTAMGNLKIWTLKPNINKHLHHDSCRLFFFLLLCKLLDCL